MSSAADPAACGLGEGRGGRAERAGHGRPDPVGRGDAGQLDQPGAVWVLGAQGGGSLHRQAGLARPARAGQCHEPAGADRLAHLFQLGAAADETAQPLPQIARPPPVPRPPGPEPGWLRLSDGSWARIRVWSSRKAKPGSMPSSSTRRSRTSV